MTNRRALGALIATVALGLSACGDGGSGEAGGGAQTALSRTVDNTMTDNAYSISRLKASVGEEVTFRFRNEGGVAHEAIVGTKAEQDAHEAEMNQPTSDGTDPMGDMPGMDHGESSAEALTVDPGQTGEITHRFDDSGELTLGCHVPDHYAQGMKITIDVT